MMTEQAFKDIITSAQISSALLLITILLVSLLILKDSRKSGNHRSKSQ